MGTIIYFELARPDYDDLFVDMAKQAVLAGTQVEIMRYDKADESLKALDKKLRIARANVQFDLNYAKSDTPLNEVD